MASLRVLKLFSTSFSTLWLSLFLLFHVAEPRRVNLVPRVATVDLYTKVEFTCSGPGNAVNWIINGSLLNDNIKRERNIKVTDFSTADQLFSVLAITASPENNNIGIGCQMINKSTEKVERNSSILNATGISPVTEINYNLVTWLLSWSEPPFYSKDIPQTADTTYVVTVNGVTKRTTDMTIRIEPTCVLNINIEAHITQYHSIANITESTYYVQDVVASVHENGSINITCVYGVEQAGLGCHVVFTITNVKSESNQSFDVLLPEKSRRVSLLTGGIYNVTVQDIVNGSTSRMKCVPGKQISVTYPSSRNGDDVSEASSTPITATTFGTAYTNAATTALTTATATESSTTGYSDNGLSTGEIAGISIAGLFVLVVVIVVIFVPYCCTKKCNNVPESKGHTEVSLANSKSTREISHESNRSLIAVASSLNGESSNDSSQYVSSLHHETTTGKNQELVSSHAVPQGLELQGLEPNGVVESRIPSNMNLELNST